MQPSNFLVCLCWRLGNPPGIYRVPLSIKLKGFGVPGPTTFPLYYLVWYIPSNRQLGGHPDTQGRKSEVAILAPRPSYDHTQCW